MDILLYNQCTFRYLITINRALSDKIDKLYYLQKWLKRMHPRNNEHRQKFEELIDLLVADA